jgi:hypothetical protein
MNATKLIPEWERLRISGAMVKGVVLGQFVSAGRRIRIIHRSGPRISIIDSETQGTLSKLRIELVHEIGHAVANTVLRKDDAERAHKTGGVMSSQLSKDGIEHRYTVGYCNKIREKL